MEKIHKTINIDNSRSHRNGLLPFVRFNEDSTVIEEVTASNVNGNYGQYVCDFTFYDYDSSTLKATIESRLKYLDVLSKYNFIQEQLRNAVYVKKYTFNNNEIVFQDCESLIKIEDKLDECEKFLEPQKNKINVSEIEKYEIRWRTEFEEINNLARYQYKPIDINRFKKEDNYYLLLDNGSDIDIDLEYCVLVPNYEKIIEYNDFWNDRWGWLTFDKNKIKQFKEENKPYDDENALEKIFWKYSDTYAKEFKFCSDFEHYVLGVIEVIDNSISISGSKVPNYLYHTNYFDFKNWFDNHNKTDKEWDERGGENFYKFLKDNISKIKWVRKSSVFFKDDTLEFKFVAPEVDVYTLLNNDMEFETLFTPYEYSLKNGLKESVVTPFVTPEKDKIGSALTPTIISDVNVKVESRLDTLVHPKAMHISNNIFGVFKEFDIDNDGVGVGQMFKCILKDGWSEKIEYYSAVTGTYSYTPYQMEEKVPTSNAYQIVYPHIVDTVKDKKVTIVDDITYTSAYTKNQYYWWECEKTEKSLVCADGETIMSGEEKYRNATILSCVDTIVGECNVGDIFYIYARYDNGRINNSGLPIDILTGGTIVPLSLPYLENVKLNTYTNNDEVIYDIVKKIKSSDNFLTIEYVIGATDGVDIEETGLHYEDVLPYKKNNVDIVPIDGVFMAELYYDTILKEDAMVDVYSKEYRMGRKVLQSTLKKMEVGSIWREDIAVSTMLFTKDSTEGLQEDPKYSINLLFNRGNAAAWENHFKLSECNTLEDLENYGNNFFNL